MRVFTSFQAITSLNKYPLPLQSAKEAKILQNFGDGICKILDEKLQHYYRDNGKQTKHSCLQINWISEMSGNTTVIHHSIGENKQRLKMLLCLFFSFSATSSVGPDASIHALPTGAPPPGKQCNNSLAPSREVNPQYAKIQF